MLTEKPLIAPVFTTNHLESFVAYLSEYQIENIRCFADDDNKCVIAYKTTAQAKALNELAQVAIFNLAITPAFNSLYNVLGEHLPPVQILRFIKLWRSSFIFENESAVISTLEEIEQIITSVKSKGIDKLSAIHFIGQPYEGLTSVSVSLSLSVANPRTGELKFECDNWAAIESAIKQNFIQTITDYHNMFELNLYTGRIN